VDEHVMGMMLRLKADRPRRTAHARGGIAERKAFRSANDVDTARKSAFIASVNVCAGWPSSAEGCSG